MKIFSVRLDPVRRKWLASHDVSAGDVLRSLIDDAIEEDSGGLSADAKLDAILSLQRKLAEIILSPTRKQTATKRIKAATEPQPVGLRPITEDELQWLEDSSPDWKISFSSSLIDGDPEVLLTAHRLLADR